MADWHNLASARAQWGTDAPSDDDTLQEYLDAAKASILAYGPTLADEWVIPAGWRIAHLKETRSIWDSDQVNAGGEAIGLEGYQAKKYSMSWAVKQLIRPADPRPLVG